jgi:uncharacterized membrane protein
MAQLISQMFEKRITLDELSIVEKAEQDVPAVRQERTFAGVLFELLLSLLWVAILCTGMIIGSMVIVFAFFCVKEGLIVGLNILYHWTEQLMTCSHH